MKKIFISLFLVFFVFLTSFAQDKYMSKCFELTKKLNQRESYEEILSFFDVNKFSKEALIKQIKVLVEENNKYKEVGIWRATKINRPVPYYYMNYQNDKTGASLGAAMLIFENRDDLLITKFNVNTKEEIEEQRRKEKLKGENSDNIPTSPVPR